MKKIVILITIVFWLIPFLINAQNYQNADLPDAMTFLDGRKVETKADFLYVFRRRFLILIGNFSYKFFEDIL